MTTLNLDAKYFGFNTTDLCDHLKGNLNAKRFGDEITLSGERGNGKIHCIDLNHGLSMVFYDTVFNDALHLKVDTTSLSPLYFIYSAEGTLEVHFSSSGKKEHLKAFQSMIVSSCKTDPFELFLKKDQKNRLIILRLDRAKYKENTDYRPHDREMFNLLFNNPDPSCTFTFTCTPDLLIADLASRHYAKFLDGSLDPLVIDGAVRMAMGYIMGQYQRDSKERSPGANLTREDLLRVREIAGQIRENPALDYSIDSLAACTGLNPFKLQHAFKHLYKRTVADYIRNVRLENAESLLKQNNLNVSEVVLAIGLNSNSYFSKIFKEKYNCGPKAYQERIKSSKNVMPNLSVAG